jgi:hypothetical protein
MSSFNSSFIKTSDDNINNTYSKPIDIYASDVNEKSTNNGSKYYEIINLDYGSNTCFYYSILKPTNYTAKKVFLFGLLHNNITGITSSDSESNKFIGELVIEHSNINNLNKVYTCYLIKNANSNDNAATVTSSYNASTPYNIDDFSNFLLKYNISGDDQVKLLQGLDFNSIIGNSNTNDAKFIYYLDTQNNNNCIIIYLKPIETTDRQTINFLSKLSKTTDLFSINAPIKPNTITGSGSGSGSGVQNGPGGRGGSGNNDKNDIFIDCSPTGVSATDIQTYNLPINSELVGNKQHMDFINISIYFIIFTFIILIIYFSVPSLYKKIVIDTSNKFSDSAKFDKLTRIRSLDILISVIILITCYYFFTDGFNNNNGNSLIIGLFIVIIFGISVSLIQYNKSTSEYMKTMVNGCVVGDIYKEGFDSSQLVKIDDILDTFIAGFKVYFKSIFSLHIALCIFASVFAAGIYYFTLNKNNNNDFGKMISMIIVVLLPVSFILKAFTI